MRVLVTGTRQWIGRNILRRALEDITRYQPHVTPLVDHLPLTLIHGGAPGIDTMAAEQAEVLGWKGEYKFPAEWAYFGSAAGPVRNKEMLHTVRPDICLAFPSKDSRGTWHMVKLCEGADIPVTIFHV